MMSVPLPRGMRTELTIHLDWHREDRFHDYLEGRTPNEVCFDCTGPQSTALLQSVAHLLFERQVTDPSDRQRYSLPYAAAMPSKTGGAGRLWVRVKRPSCRE